MLLEILEVNLKIIFEKQFKFVFVKEPQNYLSNI